MVKIVKNPGNGRLNNLNNLNDPVLNVLKIDIRNSVNLNKHMLHVSAVVTIVRNPIHPIFKN